MTKNIYKLVFVVFLSTGCATFFDDFDKKLLENKEFDQQVQIEEILPAESDAGAVERSKDKTHQDFNHKPTSKSRGQIAESPTQKPNPKISDKSTTSSDKTSQSTTTTYSANKNLEANSIKSSPEDARAPIADAKGKAIAPVKHLPEIEDGEGFMGRRPQEDPFVIGEVLELSLSYFGVEAGRLKITTRPFVNVNGNKSYHFSYEAKSSSVFSMFYSVDDRADTYVDYEQLVPYSYTISAKESKQIRDVKSYSDWKTMKAKTWDKKIKKGKDPVIEDYSWDVAPYAQNVFSAAFYLRCFQLKVGKKLAIHVAHEGKNIIMRAEIVRAERLSTPVGTLDTFVVKPSFEIDGVFKPVGDVFLWVTNDKYKRLVRIESKIKIGKVVAAIEKITP